MARILVIEDDESFRELLVQRLKKEHDVLATGDATEALALALSEKPDAVLLDLGMPEFSGFELCQTLSTLSATRLMPVLVVTGKPAAEFKQYCLNLGAADYFEKPVDFARLQETLRSLVEQRRPERRTELRVRLSVVLHLKGTDARGETFDILTAADNVSAMGFLAPCGAPLSKDTEVEVLIRGEKEQPAGRARVVRTEYRDTPWQRYGFQFVEKPENWVLK